jgi:Uma2 family endonuclease
MSSLAEPLYTAEEYLALERAADHKSEFNNGRIYAMAGASRSHVLITTNVVGGLVPRLRGQGCRTYSADMRVLIGPTGSYAYPDVAVVCGDAEFVDDGHQDVLTNPTLIVEVLSPSTEGYDRGAKFAHYRRLPSLREYVLIAQDRVSVERFARRGDEWVIRPTDELTDLGDTLHLESVGCDLPLAEVYDLVEFGGSDRPGEAQSER